MAHDHAHDHHDHHHAITLTHVSTAFVIGIVFNFLFVVIEVIVGLYIHYPCSAMPGTIWPMLLHLH
jgi:Co/Zn/Cd efflux system component